MPSSPGPSSILVHGHVLSSNYQLSVRVNDRVSYSRMIRTLELQNWSLNCQLTLVFYSLPRKINILSDSVPEGAQKKKESKNEITCPVRCLKAMDFQQTFAVSICSFSYQITQSKQVSPVVLICVPLLRVDFMFSSLFKLQFLLQS